LQYTDLEIGVEIFKHYHSCGTWFPNRQQTERYIMNLPYFKKVYMTSSNLPEDMAYRYIIVTYAHTLGRSGIPADSYEQSFRGTTSFADI
jgi:hypothetical protein